MNLIGRSSYQTAVAHPGLPSRPNDPSKGLWSIYHYNREYQVGLKLQQEIGIIVGSGKSYQCDGSFGTQVEEPEGSLMLSRSRCIDLAGEAQNPS